MAKRPNDYKPETTQSMRALPAGGYICTIEGIREVTRNDKLKIAVELEIAEGEYKGYFREKYNARVARGQSAEWPRDGVYEFFFYDVDGVSSSRALKSFGGTLDDVGVPLFTDSDDLNVRGVIGKKIGVIFRREEFKASDGSGRLLWSTKPYYTRPASDISAGNYTVPEDKRLGKVEQAFTATNDDIPF